MAKINWSDPPEAPIVVFDREGSDLLIQTVLQGFSYTVLDTRGESYWISPKILWGILKRLPLAFRENPSLPFRDRLSFWIRQVLRLYGLSCLDAIKPKVVLTYIDNSYWFQWASQQYPKVSFYAVQNGTRCPYNVSQWLAPAPHPAHVILMPDFFCYGDYERDLYTQYGHHIDRFHPVGSLAAGYYKAKLACDPPQRNYDLCLISELEPEFVSGDTKHPEIQRSINFLFEFLKQYIAETGASLVVAMRSANHWEADYFRNKLGQNVRLIFNNRNTMSTYHAIDESDVALAHNSSALREAFGWGKKVLFCNFSEHRNYDPPQSGIWTMTEPNYARFKEQLSCLRAMSETEYGEISQKTARYMMNCRRDLPAHSVIRERILEVLKGRSAGGIMDSDERE